MWLINEVSEVISTELRVCGTAGQLCRIPHFPRACLCVHVLLFHTAPAEEDSRAAKCSITHTQTHTQNQMIVPSHAQMAGESQLKLLAQNHPVFVTVPPVVLLTEVEIRTSACIHMSCEAKPGFSDPLWPQIGNLVLILALGFLFAKIK